MSDIHRLLDEAFAGVTMTPELQDLKEELRGNLLARADELQAKGMDAAAAASTAVAELGIPVLIGSLGAGETPLSAGAAAAELARLHRVRPKLGFVIAATVLSIAVAFAVAAIVLEAVAPRASAVTALAPILAAALGILMSALVDLGLRQETAQRYRMPNARAIGFGLAAGALAAGLALGGLFVGHLEMIAWLVATAMLVLAAVVAFIALGVTQTNRMKPWARQQAAQYISEDRFSQDPVAAARFGIYTVVIWTVAIALFVGLSIAVGFVWSWLALVAGVVVFFLVLNRMLFGTTAQKAK